MELSGLSLRLAHVRTQRNSLGSLSLTDHREGYINVDERSGEFDLCNTIESNHSMSILNRLKAVTHDMKLSVNAQI